MVEETAKSARRRIADALAEPNSDLLLLMNLLVSSRRNEAVYEE
jgi:hypothetical protein